MREWGGWRLWPWLPLLFGAVYLVALAADFKGLVQSLYLSSDLVSAPVIGELYDERGPGADVVLGNFPWYTTLWFERLTADLPAHRQIWQLGPWIASLAGVGLVAWSAARAAGRWAGAMVAVVLACAGPALINYQFAGSIHALTFMHVCVLGAFLVLCVLRGGFVGGPIWHVALCALVAVFTAAGAASDRLLAVAGIAPFALAGIAMLWFLPRPAGARVAATAVGVSVVAVAAGAAIAAAAEAADVRAYDFPILFADIDQIPTNVRRLAHSLAFLWNGDFGGLKLGPRGVLAVAAAVAIAAGVWAAWRFGREWWRATRALPRPRLEGTEAVRAAHVAFWAAAGLILALAFVLSTVPGDKYTSRYVLSVGYAVAALVPVAAVSGGRWARPAVVAGVCTIVLGSIVALVEKDVQDNPSRFPDGRVSGPLERFAGDEGVEHGYAGYWTAAPLTWQTKAKVKVYPVQSCTGGPTLCPHRFHRISSWYTPRPGQKSMLILDDFQPNGSPPRAPDPAFGRPLRVKRIDQLTVYVYPYDIASRFG